jgi:hypothetical protein
LGGGGGVRRHLDRRHTGSRAVLAHERRAMQEGSDGGFTHHFRPKARVRYSHAEDLAVTDSERPGLDWLVDSRGLVCVICGAREITAAEGMRAHREGCHR